MRQRKVVLAVYAFNLSMRQAILSEQWQKRASVRLQGERVTAAGDFTKGHYKRGVE